MSVKFWMKFKIYTQWCENWLNSFKFAHDIVKNVHTYFKKENDDL
jgi:hypothetical protein